MNFFVKVLAVHTKLKAVEMEAAGLSNAVNHSNAGGKLVGFIMFRGISDKPRLAEKGGEQIGTIERDNWKPYASDIAAAFTIGYIAEGLPFPPINNEN